MGNILIREVKLEDANQYVSLKNLVWRSAYANIFPQEVFEDKDKNFERDVQDFVNIAYNDDTQINYVAEVDGEIIGLMFGKKESEYEYFAKLGYADLMAIYIHPDFQGYGIGNKFKNIFIEWAKKNSSRKFVIGVLKDNINARCVYEKWGGKLHRHTQPFVKLGMEFDEVFYVFDL